MKVIVVGVDGSAHSLAALRHALRMARAMQAVIRAVSVWHVSTLVYSTPVSLGTLSDDLRNAAELVLDEAFAACADELDGLEMQRVVREGDPGHVLVAESEGAELLVVGSRGHGSFGELVLGSVSHHCCRHAHCPVTVIPHTAVPV